MKKISITELIKVGAILAGVVGGIVGISDRLYAKKSEIEAVKSDVKVVKTVQNEMYKRVDYMYQAFLRAAENANIGGR